MAMIGSLRLYFIIQYLLLVSMLLRFTTFMQDDQIGTWLYTLVSMVAYPLLYLLPALSVSAVIVHLICRGNGRSWNMRLAYMAAYLLTSLTAVLIYADYQLYILYEYHINAFVWNLLTTQGGIASLGVNLSTQLTYIMSVVLILLFNILVLAMSHWLVKAKPDLMPTRRQFLTAISLMMVLLINGEVVYAYNHFIRNDSIPQAASVIPFHLHTTSKSTFYNLGFEKPEENAVKIAYGKVHYPLHPVHSTRPDKPLNIVWLVAESLRWDMLNPQVMPNLSAFSDKALKFNNHYSGGNRTRMGMFSMFYGLDAPYWYSFQEQRVGPVLIDVLKQQNYQFDIRTSQSFSYPELKDTVFVNAPSETMHELSSGHPSWKRDELNISAMIQSLDKRATGKSFFNFMFFEATHAPYEFSGSDEIARPYLEDMNYARLSSVQHADEIKNRYINAAHSVDRQIGRLINYLEQNALLDNTIVLVTGDHGEEFMEKGHWGHGHNAKFPEEQIRVPMVLYLPGVLPQQINETTSHLDIVGTLMPLLGTTSSLADYSQGGDMLVSRPSRFVVGNYNYVGLVDQDYKIVFPFREADYFHYSVFGRDDQIIAKSESQKVVQQAKIALEHFSRETSRFIQ
jgi:membrane-anchored protein YejM (alkaline phosphatase superfamily)